jgi:flagellar assembly protein FliH
MPLSKKENFQTNQRISVEEAASDKELRAGIREVDMDVFEHRPVSDFSFPEIKKPGQGSYQSVKKKYGPLAATDPDRKVRDQKAARFRVSPVLRTPLSIEEEERRAVKKMVDAEVESYRQKVHEEAKKAGHAEGLKQGHSEAFAKFQAESSELMQHLEKLVESLNQAKVLIFQENEKFIIQMILQICQMVVLRELNTDREYVIRLAKDILERVGVRENIKIQINQKDQETIALIQEQLAQKLGTLKNLQIEVSDQVEMGGCRLETEWNAIDATIKTQLQKLSTTLAPDSESHGN